MTKISTLITITLGLCVALFAAFIRRDDVPLDKLVANLQRWTDSIPQEKVYLHMDKPYYALGDTIWFKGYLTIGARHQLSALSGAAYVELVNERDSLLQQLKLPVTSGMVMGDFILKDDYLQGSYRIRAYTQWMRNAGEDYFFDHTFLVGDVAGGDIVAKADFSYRDISGKQALTALLNYTNDQGKALGEKSIRYEIWVNHKPLWQQNSKTDALGSLRIVIPNDIRQHPEGAYIHTILQGSDKYPVNRDFPVKATLSQSDVQFFPEGGSLVNGITSRVAFKAVGIDGLGIAIKGNVVDNDNQEVAKLETLHAGMGSFLLTPIAGKTYTANITFEDGSSKAIPLPKALDEGYILSVYQPNKDSLLVRIHASKTLQQSAANLIAHTNGEAIFAAPIKLEKPITSVWLEKKAFPTGIAQFTLFSDSGEPLNERIAFIRSNDQMALDIKTAKASYNSKERIQLELTAKDGKGKPTFGNFSVAVINESKVPMDESKESTIFSNLLLTSDLKGYVEEPNYYFTKTGDDVDKALDNLMLTQGYRRFAWKNLAELAGSKPRFAAEGLGTVISGRVVTLNDQPKPVAWANINLVALRAKLFKSATTDADGRFKFEPIFMTDSIKFSLQARTVKGNDKVKLILDTVSHMKVNANPNLADASLNVHSSLKQFLEAGKKEDEAYEKLGLLDKVHRLKEVKIRAQRGQPKPTYNSMQGVMKIPEGHADKSIIFKEQETCAQLSVCLQAQLPNVRFLPLGPMQTNFPYALSLKENPPKWVPMRIVLDGRLLNRDDALSVFDNTSITPADVVKIDVVNTNQALMNVLAGSNEPVMLIYTNRGLSKKFYNPSMANLNLKGYNKVRKFYLPRYDHPGKALLDLRTTVYWNPYLKTDVTGKTTFNYYNADGPGTYRVVVEGIDADGELGRQVFSYTVDGAKAATLVLPITPADKNPTAITAPLDSFNKRLPVEKVYLHTDKPYYNIGDTLWFKSYVVKGSDLTPSKMSGLLYVELDNDSTEMVRRISIPIKNGIGAGQIALTQQIFREGGFTLRAYTNWMQNFSPGLIFSQRFYLGAATPQAWLINSNASIEPQGDKDNLQIELRLSRPDKWLSAIALKKVEVKIYDEWHYLYKEELQTGIDGSLKFGHIIPHKSDGRRIRIQITSLDKADNFKIVQVPLIINRGQNIDLQFLPEGGMLVAGIRSTVGFKAVSEDGKSLHITGSVYDMLGNKLADFSDLHNGMGVFELTPKAGEHYIAKLSKPAGIVKSFSLPVAAATGTVLHIDNSEQADELKISLYGLSSLGTDSSIYLIGAAKGRICYSQKLPSGVNNLSISKKLFPGGITRFTLFKGNHPLNERAVFIDNHDQLNFRITPDKFTYGKRDSVNLTIEVKDKSGFPVQGNFSIAVTDDSQVKPDILGNNDMVTSLLLNTELKGNIENPGYYINRKDKLAWKALDNLLLTQGWTAFDWKDVFAPVTSPVFKAEKDFKITGRVTNLFNKPMANALVLISSQKPSFITNTIADMNGVYTFQNLPTIDSGSFFIQASQANGKKMHFGNVSVEKFRAPEAPENIRNQVLPWYVNTDSIRLSNVQHTIALNQDEDLKLSGRVLKEVKIKSRKIIPNSVFGDDATLTFDEKDIKASGVMNLYELLKQEFPGIKVVNKRNLPALMYHDYYIDISFDTLLPKGAAPIYVGPHPTVNELIDAISRIQIATLKGVQIFVGALFSPHYPLSVISRAEDGLFAAGSSTYVTARAYLPNNEVHGIIKVCITSNNGAGWFTSITPNAVTYRPLPLMYPQKFYSPKYHIAAPAMPPDYRPTLYWEPNVYTDQNGKARMSFYTSDINETYTVKISGADNSGNIGDGTFKINQSKPNETTLQKHP